MLCLDANVLVDAYRTDSPHHARVRGWLDAAIVGREPIALTPESAASFVRIVTSDRIWAVPTSPQNALGFVSALLDAPRVRLMPPGPRCWQVFAAIVAEQSLVGDRIPDAYLAAAALDLGARVVTSDPGFLQVRGLQVVAPDPALLEE